MQELNMMEVDEVGGAGGVLSAGLEVAGAVGGVCALFGPGVGAAGALAGFCRRLDHPLVRILPPIRVDYLAELRQNADACAPRRGRAGDRGSFVSGPRPALF